MKNFKERGFSPENVSATLMLIVGVAVCTLVLIFSGALAGQTYNLVEKDVNSIGNQSVTAHSFVAVNNTNVSLGHRDVHASEFVLYNGTATIGAGNYSLTSAAGVFRLTNAAFNASTLYANFTYGDVTARTYIKDAVTAAFKANKTTGSYLPLIVLAAVIGLVLSMVLGFGMGNRGYMGGSL